MRVSRSLDRVAVTFDDGRLVANAGLLAPAILAERLGLRQLLDETVDLGEVAGHANVGAKAMTVIHSVLAGADSIDDCDVLRSGATSAVLGHPVAAPSTIGTFLRAFTWAHARQLDSVSKTMLGRAWAAGAGPDDAGAPFTIDVDSSIHETYGLQKEGGTRFSYTHVRGYHPIYATAADTGEVLHARLRGGNAHTARGAVSFLAETFSRVRQAGVTGGLRLRADSGFYSRGVVAACRKAGVGFSITERALDLDRQVQRGPGAELAGVEVAAHTAGRQHAVTPGRSWRHAGRAAERADGDSHLVGEGRPAVVGLEGPGVEPRIREGVGQQPEAGNDGRPAIAGSFHPPGPADVGLVAHQLQRPRGHRPAGRSAGIRLMSHSTRSNSAPASMAPKRSGRSALTHDARGLSTNQGAGWQNCTTE